MVNFQGTLVADESRFLNHQNRGLRYGDSLFETMRVVHGKLIFWEDHYLRLMSSMRILRMEIPMDFTMEYLENAILETVQANMLTDSGARVRLTIFRTDGGRYLPESREVSWVVEAEPLPDPFYVTGTEDYRVELFKDFYVNPDLLSTLKSNNKLLQIVGSIFASENGLDNCLLLNTNKMLVEALNGNLFLVHGTKLKTPPLSDGCLNGVIRKKLVGIIGKLESYSLEEGSISPFELQKADELFITNSIMGIRPVTHYRKAEYSRKVASDLLGKLNALARLS